MTFKSISRIIILTLIQTHLLIAGSELYILNSLAETISIWDGETTTNDASTVGLYPNDMLIKGDSLLVLNSGSHNLQIFNRHNFNLLADIPLPENSNPYEMTLDGTGNVLVSLFQSNQLARIDLTTASVIDTVETGPSPEGILVADGHIYVTSSNFNSSDWSYGQGKIVVHDAEDLNIIGDYAVPTNPQKLLRSDDGTLHVLCTGNYYSEFGRVVRIELSDNSVLDTLEIGGSPGAFAADTDGVVYLAAGGWGDAPAGLIYTYSMADFVVQNGESNPLTVGHGVMSVATDPRESGAWVASFDTDEVYHITADGTSTHQLVVGDGPSKIVIAPTTTTDIAEYHIPGDFRISPAYPNPFNPETNFTLSLTSTAQVGVTVYDIRGRRVRVISPEAEKLAGSYSLRWDGYNDNVNPVSSGVYILEISVNHRRFLQKVTLVR
ncbi:MAG: T9SS type A sorting domain-containing protein [Lentisphaeria bacterium]|nr:T9SS type A sorting domain-containing protein [Candidatus Neomarinimicrobiota bacterium]MCF7842698.1 T9SS type A sorting domain-containing protein [Lentisphaeria bacterium]